MGVEADVAAQEMGAFSDSRQRRREHPVRTGRQQAAHARPAPATMPRAVDQDVICHCGVLLATLATERPERKRKRCRTSRRRADMWPRRLALPSLFFVLAVPAAGDYIGQMSTSYFPAQN